MEQSGSGVNPRSTTVLLTESSSKTLVTCVKARGQHRNQKTTWSRMDFKVFIVLAGLNLNTSTAKTTHFKIFYIAFLLLLLRSLVTQGLG